MATKDLNRRDARIVFLNLFNAIHSQEFTTSKEVNAAFLSFSNEQATNEWLGENIQITPKVKQLASTIFSPMNANGHYTDADQGDDETTKLRTILKRSVEILDPWHIESVSEMLDKVENKSLLQQISSTISLTMK